jgi:hypothetical protein
VMFAKMKRRVRSEWFFFGSTAECFLVHSIQSEKEEENEEKTWSVDLHCNFGNVFAFSQLYRIRG